MENYFDHEKLRLYQDAITFVAWCGELLERIPGKAAAKDHLDNASTSIPLNIAEGNGKYSSQDRCRFLEIARGSALECATCLDVLVAKKILALEDIVPGKTRLKGIVSMPVGLMRNVSNRVTEEQVKYGVPFGSEQEHQHEQEHEHEYENEQEQKHEYEP